MQRNAQQHTSITIDGLKIKKPPVGPLYSSHWQDHLLLCETCDHLPAVQEEDEAWEPGQAGPQVPTQVRARVMLPAPHGDEQPPHGVHVVHACGEPGGGRRKRNRGRERKRRGSDIRNDKKEEKEKTKGCKQ